MGLIATDAISQTATGDITTTSGNVLVEAGGELWRGSTVVLRRAHHHDRVGRTGPVAASCVPDLVERDQVVADDQHDDGQGADHQGVEVLVELLVGVHPVSTATRALVIHIRTSVSDQGQAEPD